MTGGDFDRLIFILIFVYHWQLAVGVVNCIPVTTEHSRKINKFKHELDETHSLTFHVSLHLNTY